MHAGSGEGAAHAELGGVLRVLSWAVEGRLR
jgi:hypothetical protein